MGRKAKPLVDVVKVRVDNEMRARLERLASKYESSKPGPRWNRSSVVRVLILSGLEREGV